jgi:uncharacterized membrane protein
METGQADGITQSPAPGAFRLMRLRANQMAMAGLDGSQVAMARHWLLLANGVLLGVLVLAVLGPSLLFLQQPHLAAPIYAVFHAVCHQWPFRAFFLYGLQPTYSAAEIATLVGPEQVWTFLGNAEAGYRMPFCERNLAIVSGALAMGLLYSRVRGRLAPPRLAFFAALLIPIVLDGATQMAALRESTWEFRLATGLIAGAATVWLLFPYLELHADRWLEDVGRSAQAREG